MRWHLGRVLFWAFIGWVAGGLIASAIVASTGRQEWFALAIVFIVAFPTIAVLRADVKATRRRDAENRTR